MTYNEKSNLLDIIISCKDEKITYNIIRLLKSKNIKNEEILLKAISIISESIESYNSDLILLISDNQDLVNSDYFLDLIKMMSKCNTCVESQKLYLIARDKEVIESGILKDIISELSNTKYDNAKEYIINTMKLIVDYNNMLLGNNKIPYDEAIDLIKILSEAEDNETGKLYSNIITNINLLECNNRVVLARILCNQNLKRSLTTKDISNISNRIQLDINVRVLTK